LSKAARAAEIDMPVTDAVCALLDGADVREVVGALLSRPLAREHG
jgi:glycerol-3-phosphate dehydrogenase (NAD(P)+)